VTAIASAFSGLPTSGGTITGNLNVNGVLSYSAAGAGTNSSAAAPFISPAFANGTASQLSDLTRDYMVYLEIAVAGTAFSLSVGPTSTPAHALVTSTTPAAGEVITVRLPAGWYLLWAGTSTTLASQSAIGC